MSRCEPVSRDTLLTNFLLMPTAVVGNLRTLVVGADYSVRKSDVATSTNFIGAYDEAVGVTSTWPSLTATEAVDTSTASVSISQCLVRYFLEAEGTPTAANGLQNGVVSNEITHDASATVWAGTNRTASVITDVVVGDHVYLDTDGAGADAFETTVTGFKYTSGDPTVLVLEDNLPTAFTGGTYFNVNVDEVVASQELATTDIATTTTQISVNTAVTVTTTRTGSAKPIYSGTSPYSQAYVDYRALRQDNTSDVVEINTSADLDTYFVGWEYPESGLGFALARALAPEPTSLTKVLGAAVVTNDVTGWTNVMSRVQRRTDWYTVAPLTTDSAIQTIVFQTVAARDALGLVSRAIVSFELVESSNLFTGSTVATVSGAGNLTLTTVASVFAGAAAGDTVTTDAGTLIIDSVTSNQEVEVTTTAVGATLVTSVDHPLTIPEQAAEYGGRAQAIADRDTSVIFPPSPTWEDEVVEGYLYAAACAGLRGYTIPHQSLRGVVMETGWGVPQSTYEFLGELTTLGTYGCYVSENCDGTAGILYANTTDQSMTETKTEGLVANVDAVERYFNDLVACFAGRTKVTIDTLSEVRADSSSGVEVLKSDTAVTDFGSIIVAGEIGAPYQDTANLDTIILPVAFTVSTTLENVTVEISVTLEAI